MNGKPVGALRICAFVIMIGALVLIITACSSAQTPVQTASPAQEATVAPSQTAPVTPSPTAPPTPTPEPSPTAAPTIAVSYPPLATSESGSYSYPQVVADKAEAQTGEPVYFKIVTSDKVKSIQTIIDGDTGKIYTEHTKDSGLRIWQARIFFTKGGSRKVQFKCSMTTGGTVIIPKSPLKISVTFKYTAESTSKTITAGKTVTFTLKTPDTIDSVYAVVDGVNQDVKFSKPHSNENGIKIWKVNVTFFGLGERKVTFEAYDGSKLKQAFPDTGIIIIVQQSTG